MKIVTNKFIPFKGFGAMNILGFIFTRKNAKDITLRTKRHEQIHTYQQYELLMIGAIVSLVLCNIFASWWYLLGVILIPFVFYITSFLIEMAIPPYHNLNFDFRKGEGIVVKVQKIWAVIMKIWMDAYEDNCFEREAYFNDTEVNYLATRSLFAWVGYIIPKDKRKGK